MNPRRCYPATNGSGKSGPQRDHRRVYASGDWEIDPGRHDLRARGISVPIGPRAFKVLETLVKSAGRLVTKDELLAEVWSGVVVEENTLQVHISALRKALGADRRMLKTVSGLGYRLLSTWTVRREEADAEHLPERAREFQTNVPVAASALVGRETTVQHLRDLLSAYRLVTLIGPGGIGKTVLAAEVARRLFPNLEGDVLFVELASLSDPDLVPSAIAYALKLQLRSAEMSPVFVAQAIGSRKILLVLDNCEHVIDAAARMTEALMRLCPHTAVLATSREVLRAEGEFVYRVPTLDVPAQDLKASREVLEHSAVQLFVARTRSLREDFQPEGKMAPVIAAICRRLDGIPLAIEFAAARAAVLGVQHVAKRLDDRFGLLTGGRRTALPRHQTLRAALDWSYELLPESERHLLLHSAVFPAGFTLEAAAAVVGDRVSEVAARISNLVSKSLVTLHESASVTRWRLLETIRAYALEKLDASAEREQAARRHAEYYRNLFERAEGEATARPADEWLADYAPEIDNVRAALDWAFSPGGDGSIGVALITAAVPLWMRLSLLRERGSRAKQALGALETGGTRDPREEMRLYEALGRSATEAHEMGVAFRKALDIAESLGDSEYQLRALHGLYFCQCGNGQFRAALQSAQKFHDLAKTGADPNARLLGERIMGAVKHFLGDQIGAQRHLEQVLAHHAAADRGPDVMARVGRERDRPQPTVVYRFGVDLRVSVFGWLARVLWLQGFADQAVRTAEMSVEESQAIGHVLSLCYALALVACPISLWVGDLTGAAHYTGMLVDHSKQHGLSLLSTFASRFQRIVALKRGDLDTRSRPLYAGPNEMADPDVSFGFFGGLSEQAEALGNAGRIADGLALLEAGIAQRETGWITPELLRLKGDLLLLQKSPAGAEMAQDLFRQALDEARQQGALSWELRAATSLARLLYRQGRSADAIACLQPVYDRFTEGFGTADLIAAKKLLDELSGAARDRGAAF